MPATVDAPERGAPSRTTHIQFLLIAAAATLVLLASSPASLSRAQSGGAGATTEPVFTDPPGEESPAVKTLIDRAESALVGGAGASELLIDDGWMEAHPYPRFRDLIRSRAPVGAIAIVTPSEPGEPLIARGSLRDSAGSPLAGALVYAYQTSARGWYSDRAGHVSGNSGDERHARLFGYVKTDGEGRFEIRTIRPAGYPRTDLPAHIHLEIAPPGTDRYALVTEIRFEDDPRMTADETRRSRAAGMAVVPTARGAGGGAIVEAAFTLPPMTR